MLTPPRACSYGVTGHVIGCPPPIDGRELRGDEAPKDLPDLARQRGGHERFIPLNPPPKKKRTPRNGREKTDETKEEGVGTVPFARPYPMTQVSDGLQRPR